MSVVKLKKGKIILFEMVENNNFRQSCLESFKQRFSFCVQRSLCFVCDEKQKAYHLQLRHQNLTRSR